MGTFVERASSRDFAWYGHRHGRTLSLRSWSRRMLERREGVLAASLQLKPSQAYPTHLEAGQDK